MPTTTHYFVTAPFVRFEMQGSLRAVTGGPFHAKRMGTSLTECGQLANSWRKLWDVPFSLQIGPRCEACEAATRGPG